MLSQSENYTLVVYPDDLPTAMQTNDAWIDAFTNLGHKLVVKSPYHDKDVNPDGSKKNRIIYSLTGRWSLGQIQESRIW